MTDAFTAIERAFSQLSRRPALFDREVRRRTGRWWLASPVAVEAVIEAFANNGAFEHGGAIRVPIHEPDTAELTGEYLHYDGDGVVYYDFSIDGFRRMDLDEFRFSYPAWRVRFWIAGTNPEAVPSYLAEEGIGLDGVAGGTALTAGIDGATGASAANAANVASAANRSADPRSGSGAAEPPSTEDTAEPTTAGAAAEPTTAGAAAEPTTAGAAAEPTTANETADSSADAPVAEGTSTGTQTDATGTLLDGISDQFGGNDRSSGDGPTAEGDAFFEELRTFVEREREAERETTRSAYESMQRRAFFREFGGVQSVTPLGREVNDYGEQIINLHVADGEDDLNGGDDGNGGDDENGEDDGTGGADVDLTEEYGLYPSMEVFIDRVDDSTGFPVEAELFEVSGRTLSIGVYWDTSDEKGAAESAFGASSGAEFVVGELLNPVTFDRKADAISVIEADDRKRAIVAGHRTLQREETSYSHVGVDDLNPSQQTAARAALRATDIYCVHGPPGTGKTRTLTAIMREAVDANLRVLACAHSNQAVDNLLVGSSSPSRPDPRSIHADAVEGDLSIARVGRNTSNDVVDARYTDADTWQADVVGATTSAASTLADDMFDVAIVDEATQATIPSTLIPMTKADRTVLAGDHKQLPPYHSGELDAEEGLEFSLFEHLIERYADQSIASTLTTQYRMHEEIAAFPNAAFYDGILVHGQRNRNWTIGSLDPLVAHDVDGEEGRTSLGSYYNKPEAKRVATEVERLIQHGVMATDVGVITPYNGQVSVIRAELFDTVGEKAAERVKIDTVDSFQGGEREAIVVSFVRSNPEGNIGFLDFPIEGPRRLNVALTRAQKRLVLIGDWETLSAGGGSDDSASRYYESLREHLETVSAFRLD